MEHITLDGSKVTFNIRPFQRADRSAVLDLWERCGLVDRETRVVAEADIERKLNVQPELFLVGTIDEELTASAMAGYDGHRGHLYYLAVSPSHQRRGFGREMVAQVKSTLAERRCHRLTLYVGRDNQAVVPFYERLGFGHNKVLSMGIDIAERTSE